MKAAALAAALALAACHAAPPPESAAAPKATTNVPPKASTSSEAPQDDGKREAAIEAILQAASPRVSSPTEAKRLLDEARKKALPQEKPLLDHAEALIKLALDLDRIMAGAGSLEEKKAKVLPLMDKILGGYADLLREARPLYPDADKQVMLAATLYTLADIDAGGGTGHDAWRKEALAWTRELAGKFPKSAKVHRLLGSFCTHEDEDLTHCIKQFSLCAAYDPSMKECSEEATRLSRLYTAPRCTTDAIRKDVGVFVATPDKRPGAKEIAVGNAKAWVDTKPAFTSADFALAETLFVVVEDGGRARESEEVYLQLKPEKQGAFGAWLTRPEQPKDAIVVVLRGAKVLASAPANRVGDKQGMLLQTSTDEVCAKTERRALPSNLATPTE